MSNVRLSAETAAKKKVSSIAKRLHSGRRQMMKPSRCVKYAPVNMVIEAEVVEVTQMSVPSVLTRGELPRAVNESADRADEIVAAIQSGSSYADALNSMSAA